MKIFYKYTFLLSSGLLALLPFFLLSGCNKVDDDARKLVVTQLTAKNDSARVYANSSVVIQVLNNDIASEGSVILSPKTPQNGRVESSPTFPGFVYFPNADFVGKDYFEYTIAQNGKTSSATVNITVIDSANCTIRLQNDRITNVIQNEWNMFSPYSNDELCGIYTSKIYTYPAHGEIAINGKEWKYTPELNFTGKDSLVYQVTRGNKTESARVYFTVSFSSECPSRFALLNDVMQFSIDKGRAVISWESLLLNDRFCPKDIDMSSLQAHRLRYTQGAITSLVGANSFIYTFPADADEKNTDSLMYTARNYSNPAKLDTGIVYIQFLPSVVTPRPSAAPAVGNH
ncbi:MAG: Ig-like domain-containing protein [Bacteroidota bacterium]